MKTEPEAVDSVKKNVFAKPESRVIVTNKSSASLTNLLVYETSSEESSDDETDADVSFASKNNVIIMDSSSSSYGSTELLNEIESDSSLTEEEELR